VFAQLQYIYVTVKLYVLY